MPEPSDANALRGDEFRKLLNAPKTWIWIGLAAAVGLGAGAAAGGAIAGLVVAAILILVGLGVCFWVADSRAASAFYSSYADSRGLVWHKGGARLDGTSPFLRKGDKRKVDQLFTGPLADGVEGALALYTYTVESTDSDGNDSDTDYPFTVVTVRMPEVNAHLDDLREIGRASGRERV